MTTVAFDPQLARDADRLNDVLGELLRVVQFRDRDRACCYDVSVTQCYALDRVVHGGGMTVNQLAASLYLDKSSASRLANSLVDKAYLARTRDPEDGRVVRLVPTAAGIRLARRIEADVADEYAQLLSDFTPEVRRAVIELVRRLASSFAERVDTSGGACCVVEQ